MRADHIQISEIQSQNGDPPGLRVKAIQSGNTVMIVGLHPSLRNVFQRILLEPDFRTKCGALKRVVVDRASASCANPVLGELERLDGISDEVLMLPGAVGTALSRQETICSTRKTCEQNALL